MPLLPRRSRPDTAPAPDPDDTGAAAVGPDSSEADTEGDLAPSRMRGSEVLYGYVVALELLVVSILNLVVTTGPGAPAKPNHLLGLVGVVAAVALFPLILVKNRTVVGLVTIVAAFFVTLPRTPNSLGLTHVFALLFPVVYALVLTQRQRKASGLTLRQARAGGARARAARGQATRGRAAGARSDPARRPGGRRAAPPTRRPTGRYTPPKSRGRR